MGGRRRHHSRRSCLVRCARPHHARTLRVLRCGRSRPGAFVQRDPYQDVDRPRRRRPSHRSLAVDRQTAGCPHRSSRGNVSTMTVCRDPGSQRHQAPARGASRVESDRTTGHNRRDCVLPGRDRHARRSPGICPRFQRPTARLTDVLSWQPDPIRARGACMAALQAARRRTSQTVNATRSRESPSNQLPSMNWNDQKRLPGWKLVQFL